MSLIKGRNYIVKIPLFVVFCADEEGIRFIFDEVDRRLSPRDSGFMKRSITMNSFIFDEDELTFEALSDILEKNCFDMLGSVDVEVTDHLIGLNAVARERKKYTIKTEDGRTCTYEESSPMDIAETGIVIPQESILLGELEKPDDFRE